MLHVYIRYPSIVFKDEVNRVQEVLTYNSFTFSFFFVLRISVVALATRYVLSEGIPMKINTKLALLPFTVSLALTGCIEVDDDSNDGVVDALNQQNAVLSEQNDLLTEQLENAETSVTITGLVEDVESGLPVSSANIDIYQGETVIAESVSAQNGAFTVESLPASSDLTVVVSSSDESYLERAFFISTLPVITGEGFDDVGKLLISKPVDIAFSVIDSTTNEVVTGLSFRGYSYSGNATSIVNNFVHSSLFNEETQQYEVTLPKDLSLTLNADIDLDNDGFADFDYSLTDGVGIADNRLYIPQASTFTGSEVLLQQSEAIAEEEKTISIALVDESGTVVEGATFQNTSSDTIIESQFNEESQLYTITVPFSGGASLYMPSFTVDETTYSTGSVSFSRLTNTQTQETYIQVNSNGYESTSWYEIDDDESFTIVLKLQEVENQASAELITSHLTYPEYAYSVFYSEAVDIAENEVSLVYQDINVTKGNDSESDGVPEGYTYIVEEQAQVPLSFTQSLGGIKHTFSPIEALNSNTSYQYSVGVITPLAGGQAGDIYGDDVSFSTGENTNANFNINDLKFDNANYYSNGELIVSENTAGMENTAYERSQSVYTLLPSSIESLNYLTITLLSYNEYGNENVIMSQYELVRNGSVHIQRLLAIDVAENENIVNQSGMSMLVGTTANDGTYVYRNHTGQYLGDNTADSPVTITFSYEYQTKQGENASGTLTLPVL